MRLKRLKLDMSRMEIEKRDGKRYTRHPIADEQLAKHSDKATAVMQPYPEYNTINAFKIDYKQKRIRVFPDVSDNTIDVNMLITLDTNFDKIIRYIEITERQYLGCFIPNSDEGQSYLNMILWVVDHFNDAWSVSPYGESFYNSHDIDWGYKPNGSLRVSDHWNFKTQHSNVIHCPTTEPVNGWAVCQYNNGKYKPIKKF